MLAEWRDRSPDVELATVDRTLRKTVADRFINAIRDLLQSRDAAKVNLALEMLVEMATADRENIAAPNVVHYLTPDVIDLAKNGEPRLRLAAVRVLGNIDSDVFLVVPVLENMLAAPDANLRRSAADGLGAVLQASFQTQTPGGLSRDPAWRRDGVQSACTILAALRAGYTDSQPEVRRRCTTTLLRLAVLAHESTTEPVKRDGLDERELQWACKQLEAERADLRPLVLGLRDQTPYLTRAVKDEDGEVQLAALSILESLADLRWRWVRQGQWLLGPAQTDMPLVDDPLGENLQAALPALATALTSKDVRVRRGALDVLNVLGTVAAPAAPAVTRALTDGDGFVRWTAVRTLGAIGSPAARPAIPALARLVEDADADVAKAAIHTLVLLDPTGRGAPPRGKNPRKNAVPALVRVLNGHDADRRLAAMQALRGMGENARPAVEALSASLGDADARIRLAAAETLGELGPVARDAVPDLSLALKDPDANVRRAASEALLRIAQEGQP